MAVSHLLSLIPLMVFLIISLIFYGSALVHLLTLGYSLTLGYIAIIGSTWEVVFIPIIVLTSIIAIMLFTNAILKGDWL